MGSNTMNGMFGVKIQSSSYPAMNRRAIVMVALPGHPHELSERLSASTGEGKGEGK